LGDIEEYVLQQHAAQMTDNVGMMRGYYWNRNKSIYNNLLIPDIKLMKNYKALVDIITKKQKARLHTNKL
jgi:hypothetical protein